METSNVKFHDTNRQRLCVMCELPAGFANMLLWFSLCMLRCSSAYTRLVCLQARRIWEAVLYAQPKIRTDAGLATLAQLVGPTLCVSRH